MSDLNNDIERYLRGEMTPAEMHALEKKALSDPFLADALEGASMVKDFDADVRELNERIRPKKTYTLRIAAGVIILLSVGLFLLWPKNETIRLAEQKQATPVDSARKEEPKEEERQPEQLAVQKPKVKKEKQQDQQKQSAEAAPAIAPTVPPDTAATTAEAPVFAFRITPQTHTITGTVTTFEDKLPLPGVTVLIKGTTMGTTTDVAGNYSIDVADTSSLVFSFVGMQSSEMKVAERKKMDVKMTEDVSQLGEVVIARSPMPKTEAGTPDVKLAEPVGGLKAYDKYLENNKRYPQQALDANVKGRVILAFDVGISGELSNFTVIRSLGHGCDDEVIRLVKEGPAWNPTTESNVPVESTVHVKMKFDAAKVKKKR